MSPAKGLWSGARGDSVCQTAVFAGRHGMYLCGVAVVLVVFYVRGIHAILWASLADLVLVVVNIGDVRRVIWERS